MGDVDWIDLGQDRDRWWGIINTVINLQVPLNVWNFLSTCEEVRFSGRAVLHGVSKLLSKNGEYWKECTMK